MKSHRECPACKRLAVNIERLQTGTYCEVCGCAVVTSAVYSSMLSLGLALIVSLLINAGYIVGGLMILAILAFRVLFLDLIDARFLPIQEA